jgi:hypothetical protein
MDWQLVPALAATVGMTLFRPTSVTRHAARVLAVGAAMGVSISSGYWLA